jgi:hypothetical protein
MTRLNHSTLRIVLGLGGLALVCGFARPIAARLADDERPNVTIPKLMKIADSDDELHKLLKARFNEAVALLQTRVEIYLAGRGTFDPVFEAARHVLRSELELTEKPADQVGVRERFLTTAKDLERFTKLRYDAGQVSQGELQNARYWRIDAEIQLTKAKRKAKAEQPK